MTTFSDDFEGHDLGDALDVDYILDYFSGGSDSSVIAESATSVTGQVFRDTLNDSTTRGVMFRPGDDRIAEDLKIRMRVRGQNTGSAYLIRVISFTLGNATRDLYEIRSNGSNGYDIRQRSGGSLSTRQSGTNNVVSDCTEFHMVEAHFIWETNTIRVLVWDGDETDRPDPAVDGWYLDTTGTVTKDSDGGNAGVALFGSSTFAEVDWWAQATGSDELPIVMVSGPAVPTGLTVDTLTASSVKWVWS